MVGSLLRRAIQNPNILAPQRSLESTSTLTNPTIYIETAAFKAKAVIEPSMCPIDVAPHQIIKSVVMKSVFARKKKRMVRNPFESKTLFGAASLRVYEHNGNDGTAVLSYFWERRRYTPPPPRCPPFPFPRTGRNNSLISMRPHTTPQRIQTQNRVFSYVSWSKTSY